MTAQRADVLFSSWPAGRPVPGVIPVRAGGGPPTSRMDAGAIPDLSVSPQHPSWAAGTLLIILLDVRPDLWLDDLVTMSRCLWFVSAGLTDQVGDQLGPAAEPGGSRGQPAQGRQRDLQLDDAAAGR